LEHIGDHDRVRVQAIHDPPAFASAVDENGGDFTSPRNQISGLSAAAMEERYVTADICQDGHTAG
jgi:hypothetical protein